MTGFTARLRALALLLLGVLAFAVVPAGAAQAFGPGSATFTVAAEGAPVAFKSVTLFGPEFRFGTTDANGEVAFSDLALGDYSFTVLNSPQYQELAVGLSLTDEAPHWQQTIELTPWPTGDGSVSGTVFDVASGEPLEGITVRADRTDFPSPSVQATTDAAGAFLITGLVDGPYHISVSAFPGRFSAWAFVEISEGSSEAVELPLLAADSTITGRVVDPDGKGVGGLWVGAGLLGEFSGYTASQTDSDGYYTLTEAGAGTWEVRVDADSDWERSLVTLQVEAASTATVPDIVLVPRFTGTLSGSIISSDGVPESQIGGFFDICVTVVTLDGSPVPGASTVTGGDSFYYFWVAPGDYTVYFEDCDPGREPHGYEAAYLGGSTTLAGATVVTIETNVDDWLDLMVLQPDLSLPEPTHDAAPVRAQDLEPTAEDLIDAPSAIRRGATAEVVVGAEYAGQWVSAWLHPHATQLAGWHQVSAEGTIEITVPAQHPVGLTKLVIQDADDAVIGWTDLRVLQRLK